MTPTAPALRLLASLGLIATVVVAIVVLTSPYAYDEGQLHALAPLIGASFIATGLWTWAREPVNRTGALMVAIGFAWLGQALIAAEWPAVYIVGWILFTLPYVLLLHLLLAFPGGRLRGLAQRLVVGGGYAVALGFQLPLVLVYDPSQPCDCALPSRENPLLVWSNRDVFDGLIVTQTVIAIGALSVAGWLLAQRYRTAAPGQRHALRPVLGAGVVIAVTLVATMVADLTGLSNDLEDVIDVTTRLLIAAVPFAFLAGLARARFSQALTAEAALPARLVQAADAERRRIERDLHDGAQQGLVALGLTLARARNRAGDDLQPLLDEAAAELQKATEELRELARGIHPAVLTDRGLGPALAGLAGRASVPVELAGVPEERLPAAVESAAYFVVAEALTNVDRYARAGAASVRVARDNGSLAVEVSDDGVGGADPAAGSGLRGLADRVAALEGTLEVRSSPGAGTLVSARLPLGR